MTCQDDASIVGPVALFLGVETSTWNTTDFVNAANFAKKHNINGLIVKVSEVTSTPGDIWYGGIDGVKAIQQAIEGTGVKFLPYMFLWGDKYNALTTEVNTADTLLSTFGALCLDVEGQEWAGQTAVPWAQAFNTGLVNNSGKLFVSLPANPVDAGQSPAFQALSPAVNVWMPMAYDNYLDTTWQGQLKQINPNACIEPTLDLKADFGPDDPVAVAQDFKAKGANALTIWEMATAMADTTTLDNVVAAFTSGASNNVPTLKLNAQGCVLDIVKSFQLENGETQDACGPWTVAELRIAGLPGQGPRGVAEDADTWADKEMNKYMPNGQVNWPGTSIQQMYDFLTDSLDPVSKQRNLHWWDMATPSIDNIRTAVQAGYPVIITANEQNIIEKKSGQRAYPWNLNANHVLPVVGIDAQGDFICADQLNNNFQGYWPPVYLASRISPSWASIIQVVGPDPSKPWLAPIPSNNPATWQKGFNAQLFNASQPTPTPTPTPQPAPAPAPKQTTDNFTLEAETTWGAFFAQFGKYLVGAGLPLPDGFPNTPPTGTKIYNDWLALWKQGKPLGPALTFEVTQDMNGNPLKNASGAQIIIQFFPGGQAEYNVSTHATVFYNETGELASF